MKMLTKRVDYSRSGVMDHTLVHNCFINGVKAEEMRV